MRKLISRLLPKRKEASPRKRRGVRKIPSALRNTFLLATLVGLLTGGGWAWWSGWAAAKHDAALAWAMAKSVDAGLAIREIEVQGHAETDRAAILAALGARAGDPILEFEPDRAKGALEALPWVRSATVERHLPDRIRLDLIERRPLALWQRNGKLSLVDEQGVVVQRDQLGRFRALPIVIGEEAPGKAKALFEILATQPALAAQVATATLIGNRRWNVGLKSGVEVYLPETDVAAAWANLAEYDRLEDATRHRVAALDLRLKGRLVVRLAPVKTGPGGGAENET
ncbi:MAG: cell division protein FtsQ/DivIB [Pseudomonadota bacterium]